MKRTLAALAATAALLGLVACNPITSHGTCPGTRSSCVEWSK